MTITDEYVEVSKDWILAMFGLTDRSQATGMAKAMIDAYYAGYESAQ